MKKLNSKLTLKLKKETISVLDKNAMNTLKGGVGSTHSGERSLHPTSCRVH